MPRLPQVKRGQGNGEPGLAAADLNDRLPHRHFPIGNGSRQRSYRARTGKEYREVGRGVIGIRVNPVIRDVGRGGNLQPHGLPDAGGAGIDAAVGI